jgi:hypothetical protein
VLLAGRRYFENRSVVVARSARLRGPVKLAVESDERSHRLFAVTAARKAVKHVFFARRRDAENRAVIFFAAAFRGAVKNAVELDESGLRIGAVASGRGKRVKNLLMA